MAEPTKAELLEAIASAEAAGDDDAVSDLRGRLGVSGGESFGRGAAQAATLGFGDEIEGVVQAALPVPGDTGGFFDRYRKWRDSARRTDAASQAANPKTFTAGQVVGGVGTAAAPGALLSKVGLAAKAAQGAPWLERAATGLTNAVPYGLASGLGNSDAEDFAGLAKDTAIGGATAGGIGAGVSAVAPPVAEWLRSKGTEYGRKALSGISTPMSWNRKPISAAAVEEAYDAGAIRPWNTVTGIESKLERHADKVGATYDQIIAELESRGVTGPGAQAVARQLLARAEAERPVTFQDFDPIVDDLTRIAKETTTKVDPLNTYTQGFDPPLGLSQTRALVGNAQKAAQNEYAKIPSKVSLSGDSKIVVAHELRQAMEDAVAQQERKAPDAAAAFLPAKERLANTLQALQAAREGAGKASRRGPLSMTDMLAAVGVGGATGDLGLAGGALVGSKVISPRLAAFLGSTSRSGAQGLEALAGRGAPAARSGAASLSPAAAAELEALLEYLVRRPLGATDSSSEGGTP